MAVISQQTALYFIRTIFKSFHIRSNVNCRILNAKWFIYILVCNIANVKFFHFHFLGDPKLLVVAITLLVLDF